MPECPDCQNPFGLEEIGGSLSPGEWVQETSDKECECGLLAYGYKMAYTPKWFISRKYNTKYAVIQQEADIL